VKAGKWAKLLLTLANATADERTKLEAEAYYSWMAGNILVEKEKWEQASVLLIRAKYVSHSFIHSFILSLSLSISFCNLSVSFLVQFMNFTDFDITV
jgi:hypothetical protein